MGALCIGIGTDMERRRSKAARTRFGAARTGIGSVRCEACTRSLAGLELVLKDESGKRELFFGQAELCAKADLGRPASGECHERHAEGGVTV